jgi:nitroreductase
MLDDGSGSVVDAAITSWPSLRAFLPTPVPRATVQHLLDVAARAPSGTNMQPWCGHAMAKERLRRICDVVEAAFLAGAPTEARDYRYYPETFFEPYLARRREVGWGLYSLLGIGRGDTEKMRQQYARNFRFFEAPVGVIFTIDRRLEIGRWLDYGMFLQNVMVAARGLGLDTCPQAAFADFPNTVRAALELPFQDVIVCGMAIGYADPEAVENTLQTTREPAREIKNPRSKAAGYWWSQIRTGLTACLHEFFVYLPLALHVPSYLRLVAVLANVAFVDIAAHAPQSERSKLRGIYPESDS